MTNALEGTETATPTLRDEANARRIGRARFIGHTIGYVLIVAVIELALAFAGLRETRSAGPGAITLPNHWALLAGSIVLLLALLDLAVRRRHDRGRSGIDAALALLVIEAAYVATAFGLLPPGVTAAVAGGVAGLAGLYLLLMLALLPGNKDENRYGPAPLRRD